MRLHYRLPTLHARTYAPEHGFDTPHSFPGAVLETLQHGHDRADAKNAAGGRRKRRATASGTGDEDPAGCDPPRGRGAHVRPSARDPSAWRVRTSMRHRCESPEERRARRLPTASPVGALHTRVLLYTYEQDPGLWSRLAADNGRGALSHLAHMCTHRPPRERCDSKRRV